MVDIFCADCLGVKAVGILMTRQPALPATAERPAISVGGWYEVGPYCQRHLDLNGGAERNKYGRETKIEPLETTDVERRT